MAGAGNGISIVAFPWLVLQRNGSALEASVVAMAGTLPLLAATLIAGAAVDYLGRRRVSMISDALSALSVAAVPVLALTFGVDVINVAVLAALAGSRRVLRPGRHDRPRDDAAGGGRRVRAGRWISANSVYEAIFNLAYIVGPGIGGLLIATLGRHQHHVGDRDPRSGLSIVAISVLRLEGTGKPDKGVAAGGRVGRHRRRAAVRLAQPGAANIGLRRPGGHRPLHADGIGPVSQSTSRTATSPRSWAGC